MSFNIFKWEYIYFLIYILGRGKFFIDKNFVDKNTVDYIV